MATLSCHPTAEQPPRKFGAFFAAGCLLVLGSLAVPSRTSGQSAAEWNQIKAKCGLPAGAIYNTWVEQGAPCNQGSSASAAANAQQQLAMQATMAGAKMIGEGLHDALFGKPETPEQQQLRIAAKQLNNSGVWYMRQGDYANAIVEFQKALQKTPNNATILGNLTLARRLLEQSSRNSAAATRNSDALANILGSMPTASRPSSWDRPESLFHNIDVNFTSNTVNLQKARTSSVDAANLKRDDPPSGHPLQTKEELNVAFDKAVETDEKTQGEREQLDSEFEKLVAPTDGMTTQAKPQPRPVTVKKTGAKTRPQPASTDSQKPAEKP
jgi:tetratricopeptide (TPR) repeat protein